MIAAIVAALSSCGDGADDSSGNAENVAQTAVAVSGVSSGGDAQERSETSTRVDTSEVVDATGARPPLTDHYESVPMVFDQQSGVVVALFPTAEHLTEAWTFDVTTKTWTKRSASDLWYPSRVVYDLAADLTIAVTLSAGFTYTYDVDTDQWSQQPLVPPNTSGSRSIVALGYDHDAAHTVVLSETVRPPEVLSALSFTPGAAAWTEIRLDAGQRPIDLIPLLMTYASSIDRFVLVTGDDVWGTNGSPVHATWTLDADTGTWDKVDTAMPELNFGFDIASGTEITYVPTTDRVIVFTGGVVAEYDPVAQTWQTFNAVQTSTDTDAEFGLNRQAATLVYDPINDQVLMYGGEANRLNWTTSDDMWAATDDMWAYDPVNHTWSMVLDVTHTS